MVSAPVGVDDQIGRDVWALGFDEDMSARVAARAAGRVADDGSDGCMINFKTLNGAVCSICATSHQAILVNFA